MKRKEFKLLMENWNGFLNEGLPLGRFSVAERPIVFGIKKKDLEDAEKNKAKMEELKKRVIEKAQELDGHHKSIDLKPAIEVVRENGVTMKTLKPFIKPSGWAITLPSYGDDEDNTL